MDDSENPILYVLVIGFHHKKGCQVEYSFPPLVPEVPNECPPGWKYLPTLALPDGSHNYEEDTVFFHLPSLTNPKETVFGISCFRQIPVEKLKNRTSDITRTSVQKSVCVLSRIPLYGQIQVKMALITHAYFEEGDFSKVSILEDTFRHLNAVMSQADTRQQTFVGLSTRDFILQWKHKAVLLFKLLLLEKRVIFYKSPVFPLCSTILTLVSLFPEMIEKGLHQAACIRLSRPMSPMPQFSDEDSPQKSPVNIPVVHENGEISDIQIDKCSEDNVTVNLEDYSGSGNGKIHVVENGIEITESVNLLKDDGSGTTSIGEKSNSLRRDVSSDTIADSIHSSMNYLSQINTELCGFPLSVFTKGSLCLPYLSLPYLDLLTDVNVRSYVVGATNILFKQKRQLYDILVDIEAGRIECQDVTLRRYLHLTTEDLRFADYIVKHVSEERHDVFLDGVGYDGGDEWIRAQFRVYLLCLLRTSILPDGCREADHFNANFLSAWKDTHNYKIWLSGNHHGVLDVHPGHPFAGQLSVADMKLRLAQFSTEEPILEKDKLLQDVNVSSLHQPKRKKYVSEEQNLCELSEQATSTSASALESANNETQAAQTSVLHDHDYGQYKIKSTPNTLCCYAKCKEMNVDSSDLGIKDYLNLVIQPNQKSQRYEGPPCKRTKRNTFQKMVLSYLRKKHRREYELRMKELELKNRRVALEERRLALEERKLEIEEKRFDLECNERRQTLELEEIRMTNETNQRTIIIQFLQMQQQMIEYLRD